MAVVEGKAASAFTLEDAEGKKISLKDFKGKKGHRGDSFHRVDRRSWQGHQALGPSRQGRGASGAGSRDPACLVMPDVSHGASSRIGPACAKLRSAGRLSGDTYEIRDFLRASTAT